MKSTLKAALAAVLVAAGVMVASPAQASLTTFYAGARQSGLSETSVAGLSSIWTPTLASGDFHTLVEYAAESADSKQIVEVGWTVDASGVNGADHTNPHLFVYSWVNGVGQGYNSLNPAWVDNGSNPVNAGDSLASVSGTVKNFGIVYTGGNWWVQYDSAYLGYFQGTAWSGASPPATFTTINFFQGFGEVAANVAAPTTQMGSGVCGSAAGGSTIAKVSTVTYSSGTTPVLTAFNTNASYYKALVLTGSTRTVYLGGKGSTAPGC